MGMSILKHIVRSILLDAWEVLQIAFAVIAYILVLAGVCYLISVYERGGFSL